MEKSNLVFTEFEEYDGIIPYMAEGETQTYYIDNYKNDEMFKSYTIGEDGEVEVEIGEDKTFLKAVSRVKNYHKNNEG